MQADINAEELRWVFGRLLAAYGPQHWWPTTDIDNPRFEILIGAILTQHTAWTQVEKAIAELRAAGPLIPEVILGHGGDLAALIRSAGPHNVKAERLRVLCRWFIDVGGFEGLDDCSTPHLRAALRGRRGIGAETADAILVYAFDRPLFIADAYAFRVFERLGWRAGARSYQTLQNAAHASAPTALNADFYNELHALIVAHCKQRCTKHRPQCSGCIVRRRCAFARPNL